MKILPTRRRGNNIHRGLFAAGAVTATMGALAGWVALMARQAERRSPPQGKFAEVDGVRVHYLEHGDGPPVVLLHGNMLRAEDFVSSGLFGRLAANHRVIAVDRPGYGYSDRPSDRLWTAEAQAALVQRLLAKLGIVNPIVVGHSWGTLVAIELALRSEVAVAKLILVSGYYFPTARADVLVAAPPAIPVLGDILRYTLSPLMARMTLNKTIKAMFAPENVPTNFVPTLVREMLVRPKQLKANAQDAVFMIPDAGRLRKLYGDIKVPVVILAGEKDMIVNPEANARKLHDVINGSSLSVLPGIGHMAHYAASEQIAVAVNQ